MKGDAMEKYKVKEPFMPIVSVWDNKNRCDAEYVLSASNGVVLEVEGSEMWVIGNDGKRYLTNNLPQDFLRMGWIEKVA